MIREYTSQEKLGDAMITNNACVSVTSNNKEQLIFHTCPSHNGGDRRCLCPGHPHSAMKVGGISAPGQLQDHGREERLEQEGLLLTGFCGELIYVVSHPLNVPKLVSGPPLTPWRPIMCLDRGEPEVQGVHKI